MKAFALFALLLLAAPSSADAATSFTITAPDGRELSAAALLAGERKVVVMVAPNDSGSRLIDAVKQWTTADPRWRARVIIVVDAPLAQAREWIAERWQGGNMPLWGADTNQSAKQALGFQGPVSVAGTENGSIGWKLGGVIDDPSVAEVPMRAWIGIEAR